MSEVIQCPQCDKRYSLPEQVPATFTCRQCNTLMDLSDFGGGAEPVPPAEPPPPASRRARGRRRRGARGGGGRKRAVETPHPTPRRGGKRGRVEHHYDEDHPKHHHYRHKKDNSALIIGSVAALVVAIVLIIVVKVNKEEDPQPAPDRTKKTAAGGTQPGKAGPEPIAGAPTPGTVPGGTGTAPAGAGTAPGGNAPAGAAPGGGTKPAAAASDKPSRRGRYKGMSKVKLEVFEWPEDVDQETRDKAEEGIKAMYSGGADWSEAQDWFVAQGRPICGRLISEFKNIQDSPGFGDMGGRSLVGAIDQLLRKIDGWMERNRKELNPVRASSHPNFVLRTCQRWTWWWKYDEWKSNPMKPWDPFEDESDETESGIKEPEKKKKGGGFGKRAGGG